MRISITKPAIVIPIIIGITASCDRSATAPTMPFALGSPTVAVAPTPIGTTTLAGWVSDTAFRPLAGVQIEVIDGPGAGTSAVSDNEGHFSIGGAFDASTRFRASNDGYLDNTHTWDCSVPACGPMGAHPWLRFNLRSVTPPLNIEGDYTLTFEAAPECTDFPNEFRTRTYTAHIASANDPTNVAFWLTTIDGNLVSKGFMGIGVDKNDLALGFSWGHDPVIYPSLVEQAGPNTYLAIGGAARATVLEGAAFSKISATFTYGFMEYCQPKDAMGPPYSCGVSQSGQRNPAAVIYSARCESLNNRLTLTRR